MFHRFLRQQIIPLPSPANSVGSWYFQAKFLGHTTDEVSPALCRGHGRLEDGSAAPNETLVPPIQPVWDSRAGQASSRPRPLSSGRDLRFGELELRTKSSQLRVALSLGSQARDTTRAGWEAGGSAILYSGWAQRMFLFGRRNRAVATISWLLVYPAGQLAHKHRSERVERRATNEMLWLASLVKTPSGALVCLQEIAWNSTSSHSCNSRLVFFRCRAMSCEVWGARLPARCTQGPRFYGW